MAILRAPEITVGSIRIYVNETEVNIERDYAYDPDTWQVHESKNPTVYTTSGNTVVWADGTVLQYNGADVLKTDTIVVDGQYTTRAATPTISFKHFYKNDTLIGTGTYKFRRYSQEKPVTTEHTLTFSGETTLVSVNDNSVQSGYTLQDGDVISVMTGAKGVNINGQDYLDSPAEYSIVLSNTDIVITEVSGVQKYGCSVLVTYTA